MSFDSCHRIKTTWDQAVFFRGAFDENTSAYFLPHESQQQTINYDQVSMLKLALQILKIAEKKKIALTTADLHLIRHRLDNNLQTQLDYIYNNMINMINNGFKSYHTRLRIYSPEPFKEEYPQLARPHSDSFRGNQGRTILYLSGNPGLIIPYEDSRQLSRIESQGEATHRGHQYQIERSDRITPFTMGGCFRFATFGIKGTVPLIHMANPDLNSETANMMIIGDLGPTKEPS